VHFTQRRECTSPCSKTPASALLVSTKPGAWIGSCDTAYFVLIVIFIACFLAGSDREETKRMDERVAFLRHVDQEFHEAKKCSHAVQYSAVQYSTTTRSMIQPPRD
jgi:hypothetical protein